MASIIIGGGIALHEAIKSHKKKKAAKRASQDLSHEELQAENQRRFDRIQAQQGLLPNATQDAPPAYNVVVTDESRKAALDAQGRSSQDSARGSHDTQADTHANSAAHASTTGLVEPDTKGDALIHPAYRSS